MQVCQKVPHLAMTIFFLYALSIILFDLLKNLCSLKSIFLLPVGRGGSRVACHRLRNKTIGCLSLNPGQPLSLEDFSNH